MHPTYPVPASEEARLRALAEYHLFDTPPDENFDRLTRLAARMFGVPTVLVSLVGSDWQFFKSRIGFEASGTSREVSFCAHAIMQADIMVVHDATKDDRFSANPLVTGPPSIRFYAGKPLVAPNGENIGTVCLIDSKPRDAFTDEDRAHLSDLAALVLDQMEILRLHHVSAANQARFECIAATSSDAIICLTGTGEITFWNAAAERLFGYAADEIVGQPGERIAPQSWRRIFEAEAARLLRDEDSNAASHAFELQGLRKDGSEFPAEFSFSAWRDGAAVSVGVIVRDITERRQSQERLFRIASLDPLTELPNRSAWRDCVERTLAAGAAGTVLLIDLDGFKEVNDTYGHSMGDALLRDVAARLQASCGPLAMVARLGGDEFVALMSGNGEADANAAAAGLLAAITGRYEIAGQPIDIGASIGVAFAPQHGARPEDLLGAADLALYRAKAAGKGRHETFMPALRDAVLARRTLQQELRKAFENDEFELFYQPQVSTADGRVTGAEALMRWNHPERGLLSPAAFMEVLSRKPSAAAVGEWTVRTACRQAAEWRTRLPGFRIGINLFEAQFRSRRLLTCIAEELERNALPADAVELEIVENILLHNDAATLTLLHDLRSLGVGLAFDDYGTGFASLSLLKRYPISRLKIDRSFVRDVDTDPEDAAVVKAVIYLGRHFGMDVIAEGVETAAQLDFLKANECPEAQGYFFGKPMPARDFEARFISPPVTA